jgi:hypothetical protein
MRNFWPLLLAVAGLIVIGGFGLYTVTAGSSGDGPLQARDRVEIELPLAAATYLMRPSELARRT